MKRLAALVPLLWLACGSEPVPLPSGDAGSQDGARLSDASSSSTDGADGAMAPDAGNSTFDAQVGDAGTSTTGAISAPARTWTWVDFPESRCINGGPTGIGVNLSPGATRALIFLNGGNACFNLPSCFTTANVDGYGAAKFENEKQNLTVSLFDRDAPENRFKDASFVFLPYCTGDVFAGTVGTKEVEGTRYTFTGYRNVGLFLQRLVPTLAGVTEVVLGGISAGGFGALLNFEQVQRAFGPGVRVTLVDDSGPPMSAEFVPPCLQRHFRTLWGFDDGPLATCGSACTRTSSGTFMEEYTGYLLDAYPDRNFAVVSADADEVIRTFWGFGNDDCRNLFGSFSLPSYAPERFRAGLVDLRDRILAGQDNMRLYMLNGTQHGWLIMSPWTIEVNGVNLNAWINAAIEDDPGWSHVSPP